MNALHDCVVQVQGASLGTGWWAAPGYVVTCAHVAGFTGEQAQVTWKGQRLDGTVLDASSPPHHSGLWPYPDLAIVKIERPPTHPCARLEDQLPAYHAELRAVGFSREYGDSPELTDAAFASMGIQFFDDRPMLRLKKD